MLDLSGVKKIYFIGIGGIGMSAVAGIAKAKNFEVSGSDEAGIYEPAKGVLDYFQIRYKIGYSAENFERADLVVVMAGIDATNPELAKALALAIKIVSYAELLGTLTADKRRIVVVGAHGKGTTSGLLGYTLKNIEDSSFFVGAVLKQLKTNFYYGLGSNFVLEGDEYKAGYNDLTPKFMYYNPDILLINNLEWDHPDIYKSFEDFKKVFENLVLSLHQKSIIVYNADDPVAVELATKSTAKKISFGFENKNADLFAQKPVADKENNFVSKVKYGAVNFTFKSFFPGLVYGYDNLAAIATLSAMAYKPEQFLKSIENFKGVKRRFEIIEDSDITIIDDYAHHPTAVRMTLEATRQKYPRRRIIAFFVPHTYSRTKETIAELAKAFTAADLAFISEIYPARELKLPESITGQEVVQQISKNHENVTYVTDELQAKQKFKEIVHKGDVVVVMSVGPYHVK
jgi:UDP-N-acetylmuramate--L-alanine ligase